MLMCMTKTVMLMNQEQKIKKVVSEEKLPSVPPCSVPYDSAMAQWTCIACVYYYVSSQSTLCPLHFVALSTIFILFCGTDCTVRSVHGKQQQQPTPAAPCQRSSNTRWPKTEKRSARAYKMHQGDQIGTFWYKMASYHQFWSQKQGIPRTEQVSM